MFSWANRQLEKLSETLAPPPSTPTHRFLTALASQNEPAALSILNELDPETHQPFDVYALIYPNRGMSAIHVAASHGSINLLRELITNRGVRVDLADYQGWSPLHHACHSTSIPPNVALAAVKFLVEECHASVISKSASGQTPYDVGGSQAVRGYLLPKQLQKETQECLDNGGRGLIPGIDMGGLKVSYGNVAPPPVMGGTSSGPPGGPPPPGGMPGPPPMNVPGAMPYPAAGGMAQPSNDPSAALMQPPPARMSSFASTGSFSAAPPNNMMQPQPVAAFAPGAVSAGANANPADAPASDAASTSSAPINNAPAPDASVGGSAPDAPSQQPQQNFQQQQMQPEPPQQQVQPPFQPPVAAASPNIPANQNTPTTPAPKSNNSSAPPSGQSTASSSSGYARRGGNANAASVLNSKYKPDGFHSSSNDKELQMKYGHVANDFEAERKRAVPPPPMSGGAPMSGGLGAGGPPMSGGAMGYQNGSMNAAPNSSGFGGVQGAGASGGYATGANPYSAAGAGNVRTMGYIGGAGRSRYPTYCAVSDSVSAPPSLGGMAGQGPGVAAAAVPSYTMFNPGAAYGANAGGAGNAANSGHGANAAPNAASGASGQAQWSQPPMQTNAYDTNNAGAGGAVVGSTQGYDQNQQYSQQGHDGNQWNALAPPSSSGEFAQHQTQQTSAYPAATPVSDAGAFGYGHQSVQPNQNSQVYSPPPQQQSQQVQPQQQTQSQPQQPYQPPHTPTEAAATMFATPSPSEQPKMAADAAATMFSTPQADSHRKQLTPSSGNAGFPSLPTDTAGAQELFSSPPADSSQLPSETPPESVSGVVSPSTEPPAVVATTPTTNSSESDPAPSTQDAGSFFGTPLKNEDTSNSEAQPNAASFFGSEEKAVTSSEVAPLAENTTAKPTEGTGSTNPMPTMPVTTHTPAPTLASPAKSFGGLPPPPVIGNASGSFAAAKPIPGTPSASSFLPPPPMVTNTFSKVTSPPAVKTDDDCNGEQLSEVSLTDS